MLESKLIAVELARSILGISELRAGTIVLAWWAVLQVQLNDYLDYVRED